jgi:hypothetical protein
MLSYHHDGKIVGNCLYNNVKTLTQLPTFLLHYSVFFPALLYFTKRIAIALNEGVALLLNQN